MIQGFSISIRLTATDADANFIEFEEVSYFVGNDDPNYRLIVDDEWHTINISFSNKSSEAVANYFLVNLMSGRTSIIGFMILLALLLHIMMISR